MPLFNITDDDEHFIEREEIKINYDEVKKAEEILNEGQRRALKKALLWWEMYIKNNKPSDNKESLNKDTIKPYHRIFGYAGTGKSFVIDTLIKCFGIDTSEVAFVAFTGNAALNMIRKGNPNATTIHHLIYRVEIERIPLYDEKDKEKIVGYDEVFTQNKVDSIDRMRLIVVDEASMVSQEIMDDLLSFGIPVIMLGDDGQLENPSGTNDYMKEADSLLNEIVRQDNYIVNVSFWARTGEAIPYGIYGDNSEVAVLPKYFLDDEADAKEYFEWANTVIVGKNATRRSINRQMRSFKGFKGSPLIVGEKIVCTLNAWDITAYSPLLKREISLVNGSVGFVKKIRSINNTTKEYVIDFQLEFDPDCVYESLRVSMYNFDPKVLYFPSKENEFRTGYGKINQFDYGYTITCHKAEGNEYDKVVVIAENMGYNFSNKRYEIETDMKWLYTAVTRAKKKVMVFIDPSYYKNGYNFSDDYEDSLDEYY